MYSEELDWCGPYEVFTMAAIGKDVEVVTIAEDPDGQIDLDHLEAALEEYRDRPLKIGSFSAASNVTGIKTDVRAIATLLHKYDVMACFDYAACAPYVDIDMGSTADGDAYLDAIFVSPHKFIGGPGTPGGQPTTSAPPSSAPSTTPSRSCGSRLPTEG